MARATAKAAAPSSDETGAAGDTEQAAALAAAEAAKGAGPSDGTEGDQSEGAPGSDASESDKGGEGADEEGAELVVKPWSLPTIDSFPVTLSLENASPSARTLHAIGLYMAPNEKKDFVFTADSYEKFSRYLAQIALLNDWREGQGVIIEIEGEEDGED